MKKQIIAAAMALLFGAGALAAPGDITVRGRITDDSGKPLAGVPVSDGEVIVKTDQWNWKNSM